MPACKEGPGSSEIERVIDGQGCVGRKLHFLVNGLLVGQGRECWSGQVVNDASKNPQNAGMTTTRVYSYRRFSSGRQAHGHSLERQTASARAWCVEHGYELDEEFELSDMATSAYTGENATDGALAAFLLAAKGGKVPSGSILLVESLGRLSRNHLTEAITLLTSIVQAGIRVVSLLDGKEWNRENINDTMNFMLSVLLFARAHEESATKAKRVRAAFAKKRDAGLAVVSHGHGPGWAYPREDRQGWELDEAKAESVRKVFEHVAGGLGGIAIARTANAEGWTLPWRDRANTNTRWEHTQVSRLVRDRRVLGEWQPKQMVDGSLEALGDPVLDYFPRVITDELWGKVHVALDNRIGIPRIRGVMADVLAGLFYCKCGVPQTGGCPRPLSATLFSRSTRCVKPPHSSPSATVKA